MTETVEISSSFVADFKVGDNIVSNAHALCELVAAKNDAFNKLIVIQCGSVLEACLNEIIYRAVRFTKEGLPNISQQHQAAIANEKNDTFYQLIDVFKTHKLLDELDAGIYEELHKLRKYRNKIHIQTDVKGAPRDEDKIFSADVRSWAVKTTLKTIEFLSKTYPRPKGIEGYVRAIKLPAG